MGGRCRVDSERDRRSVLKSIGGGLAGLSVAGIGYALSTSSGEKETATTTETEEKSYRTVTVPAGEQKQFSVGSGETLQNLLIDISAKGATFDISASGEDWTVRNIGIEGTWDEYEKAEPFRAGVADGSRGTIENFYFADGAPDDSYPGVTGIYVRRTHAGTLRINRTNIQDMPDNAIYASTPGRPADNELGLPPGGGGVVEITNSFAKDCQASHFRLGTDGSFAKNCVAVGGDGGHRGFLGRFNNTKAIDCDLANHSRGDVACGTFRWEAGVDAVVTLENCRFETIGDMLYQGEVVGESVGEPRTEPPDGVPRKPAEAASGASGTE